MRFSPFAIGSVATFLVGRGPFCLDIVAGHYPLKTWTSNHGLRSREIDLKPGAML